jgi:uncharacterized RDD family membrane protein YckC
MSNLDDEQVRRYQRDLITPEGVPLKVTLASPADRLGAACIDLFVVIGGTVLILLVTILVAPTIKSASLAISLGLFVAFVLRLLYFPLTELAWQGQTAGKRMLGLRVVRRDGVGLTLEAEIVRSLMREIELWLPFSLILSLNVYSSHSDTLATLLASLFLAVICAIPLFNKDVMRAGDMLAGTWVLSEPRAILLPDLTATAAAPDKSAYVFTPQQLKIYGIHELEMLANVLRDVSPNAAQLRRTVAETIQRKIGFTPLRGDPPSLFLNAYYRALRRHLEQGLLFGKRRLNKYDIDQR